MGRERLHAHVRRIPAARRAPGRSARPPAHVHDRPDPVLARLTGRWPGSVGGLADHRARDPGPRRRDRLTCGALDHHHHVRRRRRAQPRARRLGCGRRCGRRGRRAARRNPHERSELALGAVRQRPDRDRRSRTRPAPAVRESRRRWNRRLRRTGRGDRHGRPRAARIRGSRRRQCRVGIHRHAAAARRVGRFAGGVHHDRATPAPPADAVLDLPPADASRRGHRRPADRDVAVLDVLLHLALHAGRPALLTDQGRGSPTCRSRSGSSSRPESPRSSSLGLASSRR